MATAEAKIGRVEGRSVADLQPATLNSENGNVLAVVSTGEPVWRGRFYEQLDVDGADLSSLQQGAPVFTDHRHKAESVIGRIEPNSVQVRDGQIEASINFNKETAIWPLIRDGHLTQLSVGYAVLDAREEAADDGSPVQRVTRWQPLEVSAVGLGAERGARLRSADGGDDGAPDPDWRIDMAARAHADGAGELAGRILNGNMTQQEVSEAMIRTKEEGQAAPVQPHVRTTGGYDAYEELTRAAPEALSSMIDGREPTDDYAKQLRGLGPLNLAREVLTQRGEPQARMMSPSQVASRAMHTTSEFPALLTEAGNRSLVEAYQSGRSPLTRITRTNDSIADFREVSRVQLGAPPELKRVGEHSEIPYGSTDEKVERYSLDTYAVMAAISRQALINDDLSAFQDGLMRMARSAAQLEADKIADVLRNNPQMSDGVPLFDASHDNVVSTSQSVDVDGLDAARSLMRAQVDTNGHPLNLSPTSIVVAAEDETEAQRAIASVTPDQPANANPFSGALAVLPEARLNGEGKFWLFANPSNAPVIEIGFLNGNRGPQLESREGWNTLGIEYRVVFDFGIGVIDHRGAVQTPKA